MTTKTELKNGMPSQWVSKHLYIMEVVNNTQSGIQNVCSNIIL